MADHFFIVLTLDFFDLYDFKGEKPYVVKQVESKYKSDYKLADRRRIENGLMVN
jgi:hypothetical protein